MGPSLFLSPSHHLPRSFCSFLPCYVLLRQDLAHVRFLFWKSKELLDSGLPHRHTQEALLKPRLNPTLLCLTLHTSIHSESFLISWILCCTLTPQRHPEHCTGWYSNPGSDAMSQGEMLLCFCGEHPEERRTISHLKLVRLGSEIISPHYILLEVVFSILPSCLEERRRQTMLLRSHVSLQHRHLSCGDLLAHEKLPREASTWNAPVVASSPVSLRISFGLVAPQSSPFAA